MRTSDGLDKPRDVPVAANSGPGAECVWAAGPRGARRRANEVIGRRSKTCGSAGQVASLQTCPRTWTNFQAACNFRRCRRHPTGNESKRGLGQRTAGAKPLTPQRPSNRSGSPRLLRATTYLFEVLHLLAHLLDEHLELEHRGRKLLRHRFRAEGVRLAVELLHEKVEAFPLRAAAREDP